MAEFEVDDLVLIGEAGEPGVVVLAAGRAPDPDLVPENLPDLNGLCCTPIALVRTLSDGCFQWVRAADLIAVPGRGESRRGTVVGQTRAG